jgi:enoyl-CoA hydratase/carnithine racemase
MLVTRQDQSRISILTLNNPPANGYSHAMHRELDDHILEIRMNPEIDVVILTGAGDKFFCAGADINYLRSLAPEQKYAFCLHANETLLRLENTPKLVIAALNGHCVGGGLEIALACDIRIGKASGEKPNLIGLPEVNLGVLPGTGGTQRLTRILGRARALQWMVEGRNVAIEEAATIGLVHAVFPVLNWWDAVLGYARSFTRPGRAAGAVGLIKRAVLAGADLPLESGLALERELQQRLFTAPDAQEGLAAFTEKRPPFFQGWPSPEPVRPEGYRPPEPPHSPPPAPRSELPRSPLHTSPRLEPPPPPPRHEPPRPEPPAEDAWALARKTPPVEDRPASDFPVDEPDPFDTPRAPRKTLSGEARLDLSRVRLKDEFLNLLSRDIVETHLVLPIKKEGMALVVACANPSPQIKDLLEEELNQPVKLVAASEMEIAVAIAQNYRA